MLDFIESCPVLFIIVVGLLGLIVGSFLNVIIYRLPLMLTKNWKNECRVILEVTEPAGFSHFSLHRPASHCPHCQSQLTLWHKIPLVSFIFLKGHCAFCHAKIAPRYWVVELLSAAITLFAAMQFDLSWTFLAVSVLGWLLIVISFIDIEHQLIPDVLTLTLLWIGLFVSCFDLFTTSHDAILGAIFGYGFLWIIGKTFQHVRQKEGLGLGDAKLMAAAGAWIGWQLLPLLILFSSLFGLIVGLIMMGFKKIGKDTPIPFAPFIALVTFLAIFYGFDLTQFVLHYFNIPLNSNV